MALADIFQKAGIEPHGVAARRSRLVIEPGVIRMDIDERHAAMANDPVEFLEPDIGVALAQQEKQGGVLRECIGEFHVAGSRQG